MNKVVPAHNIGSYVPMIDGPEKVSGRAKYTADIVQPGQLAGRIYLSPYSHGEIVNVDVSEALKVHGVVSIVTGADCDKTFGVLPVARRRGSKLGRQDTDVFWRGGVEARGQERHAEDGAVLPKAEALVHGLSQRRRVEAHHGYVLDAFENGLHEAPAEACAPGGGVDEDHADPGQSVAVAGRAAGTDEAAVTLGGHEPAGIQGEEPAPIGFALVPARGSGEAQGRGDVVLS